MTKSAVVPHGQGEETQQERTDGADPTKALPRSGSVSGDHAILRTITTVLQRVQVVDSWSECAEGLSAIVAQLQHTWKYRFLYCLLLVRVALNCYNVCNNVLEAEAFNHLSAKFERAAVASDEYRTTTAWVFVIELAFVMAFVIACITSASLFFWRSRRHNTNRTSHNDEFHRAMFAMLTVNSLKAVASFNLLLLMPRVTSLNILFKFPQLWAAAKQTYAATGNFLRMVGIVLFPVAWLLASLLGAAALIVKIRAQVPFIATTYFMDWTWAEFFSVLAFANNLSSLTDLEAAAVNSIVRFVCTDTDNNMTPTELLAQDNLRRRVLAQVIDTAGAKGVLFAAVMSSDVVAVALKRQSAPQLARPPAAGAPIPAPSP